MTDEDTNERPQRKEVPAWAVACLGDFLHDQEQLSRLLHLSMTGISMIRGAPQLVDALAALEPEEHSTEEAKKRRQRIEEEAVLAQKEVDEGFPRLHGQSVIALWGALEALVRTLVGRWLLNTPGAFQVEAVRRLRVRVGEFEALSPAERALHVVELLEQEVGAGLKPGVGRFEALLEPFGLSGGVTDIVRRTLFELSQVRNVLVHQRGVIDRRLAEQCPWLKLTVGQQLIVTHQSLQGYDLAAAAYVGELIQRLRTLFDRPRDKNLDRSVREWEQALERGQQRMNQQDGS